MKRAFPLVTAAVLLAACGSGGTARPMMGRSEGVSSASATAGHNAQDVMFAQMMIPHHRQAIAMAETEQRQGADPDAKALAGSIVASQSADIARMRSLLK